LSMAAAELRNSSGNFTDCFRIFRRDASYREGASSEVDQGGLTMGGRGQGLGRTPLWCGQPLAPVWSSSFVQKT
jgi:hypothetical protein